MYHNRNTYNFKFSIGWLGTMASKLNLSCYLTHGLERYRWIHPYPNGICVKGYVTTSIEIRTFSFDFLFFVLLTITLAAHKYNITKENISCDRFYFLYTLFGWMKSLFCYCFDYISWLNIGFRKIHSNLDCCSTCVFIEIKY